MPDKSVSAAQLARLSLRITLLVFNRGLTQLPNDTLPLELVEELKSGIRDAHDFLISGARTDVVSTVVASRLSSLLAYDFHPLVLYSHAFSADRRSNRRGSDRIPIEQDGTVIEFPTPAGAFIQTENLLRAAAESRRLIYLSAVAEVERLAFNAHRFAGKPQRLFHPAIDFAHNGEIFLNNATLDSGELRWTKGLRPREEETRITTEGEFVRRLGEALDLLGNYGIHPGCFIPPCSAPSNSAASGRHPKTRSKRKS
ncbi:hypothetical protein [uncultured Roseibium sp.]|uniref:hypothetical protein n=1 Tax=uncultured Roseibium sp. TaxID=1936171 RepID=UPI0026371F90|nr:hypothetical protein [uncultured Roseibium sp.]